MKWIFIVTWITVHISYGGAPPTINEYGIVSQNINAVAILHKSETNERKVFDNKKEAELFIKNAPQKDSIKISDGIYITTNMGSYCKDFKIDSAYIKKDFNQ